MVFQDILPTNVFLDAAGITVRRIRLRGGDVYLGMDDASLIADPLTTACAALEVGGAGSPRLEVDTGFRLGASLLQFRSGTIGTEDGAGAVLGDLFFSEMTIVDRLTVGDRAPGLIDGFTDLEVGSMVVGGDETGRIEDVVRLLVHGRATVGDADLGELLDSGLQASDMTIGATRTGLGAVVINGPSDQSMILNDLEVGARGFGLLDVRQPFPVGGDVFIGVFAGLDSPGYLDRGDGLVIVRGQGTVLDVGQDLMVGLLGHARLEIEPGARITVGGSVSTIALDGGVMLDRLVRFRLGEPSSEPIVTAGESVLLPETEIRLAESLVPAPGQSWILVSAEGTVETMGLSFEALPPGLHWTTTATAGSLTVSIGGTTEPPADINADGTVDLADLLLILAGFGPCVAGEPCPADLDGSGSIDFADIAIVLSQWA